MSICTKTIKRIISVILIATMIFALSAPISKAESADKRTGISIKDAFNKVNDKIFSYAEGSYYSTVSMNKVPATFEAWVYIPKSVYSIDCGVIFGNYAGYDRDVYITYEILKNGVPCFSFGDRDGTVHEYKFSDATIEPDTWTHLAVVYGAGNDYEQIYCYINGEKKHEFGSRDWAQVHQSFSENMFSIAGDMRCLNSRHFRGMLGDIAVYSDVRKEELIKQDILSPERTPTLMAYYRLFNEKNKTDMYDLSGNERHMYYCSTWTSEKEMASLRVGDNNKYAYTLALISDTQYMTASNPQTLHYTYDWLIDNASRRNIKYVLSMGDMTNNNTEVQWQRVKEQTDRLNGIVPYTVMRGNHDTTFNDGAELFDEIYSDKNGYYYNHVKENGGFYDENSVKNVYLLFSAGKVDYLILSLDFGVGMDVALWADKIIKSYPERRVIVVTHAYLNADGTRLVKGDQSAPSTYEHYLDADYLNGDELWNNLIFQNDNVALVACGHMHADSIVVTKDYGRSKNTVYQMLVDAQTADSMLGGLGLIGLMYFTENGEFAAVEYYSPVWNSYFMARRSRTVLTFPAPVEEPIPEASLIDECPDKPAVNVILIASCTLGAILASAITVTVVKKKKKK